MVKYPRIVSSLADKKVVLIACGGLHNAVVTVEGKICVELFDICNMLSAVGHILGDRPYYVVLL